MPEPRRKEAGSASLATPQPQTSQHGCNQQTRTTGHHEPQTRSPLLWQLLPPGTGVPCIVAVTTTETKSTVPDCTLPRLRHLNTEPPRRKAHQDRASHAPFACMNRLALL